MTISDHPPISLLILIVLFNFIICPTSACEPGWDEFGIHCYKAVTFTSSYGSGNDTSATFANQSEAQKRCQSQGAQLASIHCEAENDFIKRLIYGSYERCQASGLWWCIDWYIYDGYWLGMKLTRDTASGRVTGADWTDGTPVDYGSPMNATVTDGGKQPWYQPEKRPTAYAPPNYACVYALMTNRGIGWADYACNEANTGGYVCKKAK